MSSIEAQRRAHLESKAVAALRARLARQEYMPVLEVAHRLNLSRDKVEEIPREILPYTDFGKKRSLRRYHPADVQAIDARMRAWNSATSACGRIRNDSTRLAMITAETTNGIAAISEPNRPPISTSAEKAMTVVIDALSTGAAMRRAAPTEASAGLRP